MYSLLILRGYLDFKHIHLHLFISHLLFFTLSPQPVFQPWPFSVVYRWDTLKLLNDGNGLIVVNCGGQIPYHSA